MQAAITGLDERLAGLADRRPLAMLFVALFALLVFLPGFFSLPPVDEDEVHYAQAARQMAVSGDFVDIRFGTAPRYKKPIGIYWLQAGADLITGNPAEAPIWVNRLPSLIAAAGAAVLTYWIGATLMSGAVGLLAALMLSSSLVMGFEARMATTDAVLLLATLGSLAVLARLYAATASGRMPAPRGWAGPIGFWLGLSAGVLVKGPIAPMVVGLTAAGSGLLERSWRWLTGLRPVAGFGLFLLLTAPWFIAIWFVSHGTFYATSLGGDLLAKVGHGQQDHGAPFGTYALALFLYFWPAAPLVLFGVPFALRTWREPFTWFCLTWVVPAWLVFEAAASKLPNYVLPLLPGLALLSAAGLHVALARAAPKWRLPAVALLLLPGFALPMAAANMAAMFGRHLPVWFWPLTAVAALALLLALMALRLRAPFAAVVALGLASLGAAGPTYEVAAGIPQMWTAREIGKLLATHEICQDPAIVSAGYVEPSLVYWLDKRTVRGWASTVISVMSQNTCALGIVEDGDLKAVQEGLAKAGVGTRELGVVDGFDLGQGHRVKLHILLRMN